MARCLPGVEEFEHALEESIALKVLRSPNEFFGDDATGLVTAKTLDAMELGEPDASGRRRPVATDGEGWRRGQTETMKADLVITRHPHRRLPQRRAAVLDR